MCVWVRVSVLVCGYWKYQVRLPLYHDFIDTTQFDKFQVKRLAPNSIADADGRLQKDDRIIAINGTRIKGMSQGDALNILSTIKDTVVLTICRTQHQNNELIEPVHTDSNTRNGILKKSNSEACIPALVRQPSGHDVPASPGDERQSRSKTKKDRDVRSQSETRELKRKSSTRSRSRSPGIFSRIFRSSSRASLGDVKTGKNGSKAQAVDEVWVISIYPAKLFFFRYLSIY